MSFRTAQAYLFWRSQQNGARLPGFTQRRRLLALVNDAAISPAAMARGLLSFVSAAHYEGRTMTGMQIGEVTHFYNRISVAVLALTDTVRLGDSVHFLGRSTDFRQKVASLQIEHQPIDEAGPGRKWPWPLSSECAPGTRFSRSLTRADPSAS